MLWRAYVNSVTATSCQSSLIAAALGRRIDF
jgi:hypothetical protein